MNRKPLVILFLLAVPACLLLLPLIGHGSFLWPAKGLDEYGRFILTRIRFPQSVSAFLIGAALASVGLVFQTLFKNDLADPYLLGVSSGSALGVVLSSRFAVALGLPLLLLSPLAAFITGLLTVAVVLSFSRSGRSGSDTSMVLIGTGMNFFVSSLILLIYYFSSPAQVFEVQRWFMGSLEMVGWREPTLLAVNTGVVLVILFFFREDLNIMLLSEEMALSKGLDTSRTRTFLVFIGSWLTAFCVSVAGPIAFVGLVAPHLTKLVFGRNHGAIFILNALLGGVFLLVCFTLSRCLLSSSLLPVGIVTSLIGVPFLVWLIAKKK